jgi:hypothetical protein
MTVLLCWASPDGSANKRNLGTNVITTLHDLKLTDTVFHPVKIEPTISVNPTSLDFGTVMLGQSVSKTFKVKGLNLKGNLTLQVLSTRSSSSDGFTIDKTVITPAQALRGVTVRVTYKPTHIGTQNTTSVYITGGGAQGKVVALTGTCEKFTDITPIEPSLTVTPTSIDFGTVKLGQSVSKTFTVRGLRLSGPLTLQVLTTRSSSSDGFTIDKTVITPAQAMLGVTVLVTYRPLYVGTQSSTLVHISGGGVESQDVALTGTCIKPELAPSVHNAAIGSGQWGQSVNITAQRQNIVIDSPVDQSAVISDTNGHSRRVNLKAGRNEIPVVATGIHIVRVGDNTAKLLIK